MATESTSKEYLDRQNPEALRAFGRRLYALRRAMAADYGTLGALTKTKMADLLGVEHERYARWEKGEINPPLHILTRIRTTFNISLDQLIAGVPNGRTDLISYDGLEADALSLSDRLRMTRIVFSPDPAVTAQALAVSQYTLSRWESGSEVPPVEKMIEFAHRAGVTLDFLYSGHLATVNPARARQLTEQFAELRPSPTPASSPQTGRDTGKAKGPGKANHN